MANFDGLPEVPRLRYTTLNNCINSQLLYLPNPGLEGNVVTLLNLMRGIHGNVSPGVILVILRACIDECSSHKDPDSPLLLFGNVSRLRKWSKFDKVWGQVLRKERVPYFHAKELMDSDGPFKGWSGDRKYNFCVELEQIIRDNIDFSFCTVLQRKDFLEYRNGSKELNSILDSDFGVSFKFGLHFMQMAIPHLLPAEKHDVYVVVENGHQNCGSIVPIHRKFMDQNKKAIFKSVTALPKTDCYGFQASDLSAFAALCQHERANMSVPVADLSGNDYVEKMKVFYDSKKREAPVYRLALNSQTLSMFRDYAILSKPKFKSRFSQYLSSVMEA